MQRVDACYLIAEDPNAHGVHDSPEVSRRRVYCEVASATRSEYYTALNAGIAPEYVLKLAIMEDYQDEKLVEFRGKRYRISRTYLTGDGGIELTIYREDVN
jgi:hypothetical protein